MESRGNHGPNLDPSSFNLDLFFVCAYKYVHTLHTSQRYYIIPTGPAGEAPCILQRDQLPLEPAPDTLLHTNNWLCPDMPVLPGGAVHMSPHQASVPYGYLLWG